MRTCDLGTLGGSASRLRVVWIADFTPTINAFVGGGIEPDEVCGRLCGHASDRLDVGSADHAPPFLGFVLDQLSEILRRSDHNVAIHVGELLF